jgi:hypothetical protein
MAKWNWERIAAGSGVLFVALFVIAFFIPGTPPDLSDSNTKWVNYVHDNRRELKASAIVFGLALIAFIWFAGSLATRLRNAGEQRLAGTAFGFSVATGTIAAVATAIQAALAYRIAQENPGQVKTFVELQWVLQTYLAFTAGAILLAVAIASWRTSISPRWYSGLTGVAAVALVVSGGGLSHKGFYAPDGGYGMITLIVFLGWTLATSLWLVSGMTAERTPTASAVPTA